MFPQRSRLLAACCWLSLVGSSVGNVLDLGPIESVRIAQDEPSAEQISILLGNTYRCDKFKGPPCTVATMCRAYGVTDLGPREITFTPYRAGSFTCRMSGIKQNFVVYDKIVASRGEIKVETIGNLRFTAPDGGLKASIGNIGVEAKDGQLSVYNLPFYDDVSQSFLIGIVMENSSVYEVPLRVVNEGVRCEDSESMTRVTVTRDLGKNDINSFENLMAALKCIKEKFSDGGNLIDGACFPEEDQTRPSFPILFNVPELRRGSADCFGFSVTDPHKPSVFSHLRAVDPNNLVGGYSKDEILKYMTSFLIICFAILICFFIIRSCCNDRSRHQIPQW